jgi:large subunit ribosomal protein L19
LNKKWLVARSLETGPEPGLSKFRDLLHNAKTARRLTNQPARRKEITMQNRLMDVVEKSTLKTTVPKFEIGDTVDVHVRILEGDKERIQIFNGFVIARSGAGPREMFVVRRIVQGEGVERKFPIQSPRIADIVVKLSGKVRRAKLYYLRQLSGKAVRLKERFTSTVSTAEAKAAKAERKKARAAKKEKAEATTST